MRRRQPRRSKLYAHESEKVLHGHRTTTNPRKTQLPPANPSQLPNDSPKQIHPNPVLIGDSGKRTLSGSIGSLIMPELC